MQKLFIGDRKSKLINPIVNVSLVFQEPPELLSGANVKIRAGPNIKVVRDG